MMMTSSRVALSLGLLVLAILIFELEANDGCEDNLKEDMKFCLSRGRNFLSKYLKHAQGRGSRRARKNFDMCRTFNQTMKSCLDRCPAVKDNMHSHWRTVYDVMACTCDKNQECIQSVQCFEEQYYGTLGQGCDDLFKFKARQQTRPVCHFLKDRLNCKMALVSTACDSRAETFAHDVHMLHHRSKHEKHSCRISWDKNHDKFRYTDQCSASKMAVVGECEKKLKDNLVFFDGGNDLVADSGNKALRKGCKDFKEYTSCMEPIEAVCEQGISLHYMFKSYLRRYHLKMQYICNEKKEEYLKHLKCYQELLSNHSLSVCDSIWDQVKPILHTVSSHEYYCLKETPDIIKLRDLLSNLRTCYEGVFRNSCTREGGDVIGELMRRAFKDPFYLGFEFIPDCDEHISTPADLELVTSSAGTAGTVGKRDRQKPSLVREQDARPKTSPSQKKRSAAASTATSSLTRTLYLLVILPLLTLSLR